MCPAFSCTVSLRPDFSRAASLKADFFHTGARVRCFFAGCFLTSVGIFCLLLSWTLLSTELIILGAAFYHNEFTPTERYFLRGSFICTAFLSAAFLRAAFSHADFLPTAFFRDCYIA